MPNSTLVEDGVTFEIVEDQSVGEFLYDQKPQASSQEPVAGSPEVTTQPVATPRQASPAAKVEVVAREPEQTPDQVANETIVPQVNVDQLTAQLDEWIKDQLDNAKQEGARSVQSTKDREVTKLQTRLTQYENDINTLRQQIDETKLAGLTDAERETYLTNRSIDQERASLKAMADEIDSILKAQVVVALVEDYGQYGVNATDLEELDEPGEMERFCERAELAFYRKGGTLPNPTQSVQNPTNATPAPTNARPVPAGAQAPSDLGGTSPSIAPTRGEVAKGTGSNAMAQTLNALPFETVRIG